ncbi:MAG: HAD-IIB family hydrolase [Myxococcales bacterium]|nr:HAD-IIB family hydrolase [Polyangiaceae bacterium]MDW8247879.1 HAD-IIB family hydrolase [Myxococcales bacterium]
MRPLDQITEEEARRVEGLILDLDDTILDHGYLEEEAFGALHRVARSGLLSLIATGRPAGWGEVLARQWPVAGVVTENGAVAFQRIGAGVERFERVSPGERQQRRHLLECRVEALQERFPELRLADDNGLRRSDITLDVGEREQVPAGLVREVVALAKSWGLRVTVSSIHLHLSLDGDDKASGVLWFLRERLGVDPTRALGRWAFVGDSLNDAPCFGAFSLTFGVANVSRYVSQLSRPPRYVAKGERGAGFAEIVGMLLARRGS